MSTEPNAHDMFAALDVDPATAPTKQKHVGPGQFTSAEAAKKYMMAGKATVTVRSVATGTRFTYRLSLLELKEGETAGPNGLPIFVSLMTGPDNNSSFQYFGHIFSVQELYWHGRKSKISEDAPGVKAFKWVWAQLLKRRLPDQLEIWHEGACGRCGRKLTVPSSIESGFGPECIQHI